METDLSPKKAALQLLSKADENITYEEIMYKLHILQKIQAGLEDVNKGDVTPHNKVKKEFQKWLT